MCGRRTFGDPYYSTIHTVQIYINQLAVVVSSWYPSRRLLIRWLTL